MGEDLCEKVVADPDDYSPMDTGDGGLDVVGWTSLDDSVPSNLIVLGQCACTPNWFNKQSSSSYGAWSNKIAFVAPPSNMCFIPFFFRRADGTWHKVKDIHSSILIDRLRLVTLLQSYILGNAEIFVSHPAYGMVEEVLQEEGSVF